MTEPFALTLTDVRKRFGATRALDGVSFSVSPGEVVGVLGPSGAGKSTLFRCLTGLVRPDSGRVTVLGRDIGSLRGADLRAHRRQIGLIFQQFNLIGRMDALGNILAGRLGQVGTLNVLLRRFPDHDRQIALAALDRVGLLDKAYQRADALSGGQQQRVAIARVLAQRSSLLLADEPVASLDPRSAENVLSILRVIAKESGIAVLCALHQTEYARRFTDRIVALREGRLAFDVTADRFDVRAAARLYADRPDLRASAPADARGEQSRANSAVA